MLGDTRIEIDDLSVVSSRGVAVLNELTRELKTHWYAAYTCAQHEKSVARQLELRSIESFLPLYEKVSRWKDRRVKLQLPLFSGYVFVRMPLGEKLRVLEIPGVVRLVGFNGYPAPLDDHEMEAMRKGLFGNVLAEPHPFLTVGRRMRIINGPFAGLEGILKQHRSNLRVVVSLCLIQRSIAVDVHSSDVAPMI